MNTHSLESLADPRFERRFRAINFDPRAKRDAEACALSCTRTTGRRFVVEYRDHYDDTRVAGDYIVRRA